MGSRFIRVLVLAAVIVQISAFATEIVWLELTPNFSYRDLFKSCSSKLLPNTLYFSMELDNTKMVRVMLHTSSSFGGGTLLKEEEMAGIELYIDKDNRLWLRTLPLSTRLLQWFFYHSSPMMMCTPPKELKVLEPLLYVFHFSPETEAGTSVSDLAKFSGIWENKDKVSFPYQIDLQLTQEQFKDVVNH